MRAAAPTLLSAMTPFPWSVEIDQPLERAREMMREHAIRHLPVVREGKLVGVIDDRHAELMAGQAGHAGKRPSVASACRLDPYVVDAATPLEEVLREMAARRTDAALVTRKGRLAGIFTASDAFRCFSEFLRTLFPPESDDAA